MADKSPSADASAVAQEHNVLVETLPPVSRLALAYAPAAARLPTLALFALDTRLAGLLRNSREPMLAQLRFSWWRETLGRNDREWPAGEPLLNALRSWNGHHTALTALVEGWEALTGPAPLPIEALRAMALGRADAFAGLAHALGCAQDANSAHRLGLRWGLADLAVRLADPRERVCASESVRAETVGEGRISRPLRSLLILHGLAMRRLDKGEESAALSPGAMLKALRLGVLGR